MVPLQYFQDTYVLEHDHENEAMLSDTKKLHISLLGSSISFFESFCRTCFSHFIEKHREGDHSPSNGSVIPKDVTTLSC